MTEIIKGDCRAVLPTLNTGRFRCCVTSVPYWEQRDYLSADHPDRALEIGHESSPALYIGALVEVFREIRRVLADDGTLWVNIGNGFARAGGIGAPGASAKINATKSGKQSRGGHRRPLPDGFKDKDLIPLAWMLGIALIADGWWLRADNIWAPPNAMPESVTDRTTIAHEYVLLLSKSHDYFFDQDAIREPQPMAQPRHVYNPLGRNCRSVWSILTEKGDGKHVAPMPRLLARRCILAGSARGDEVLDPFGGSGTVGVVCAEEGRRAMLIDLDEYATQNAKARTIQGGLLPLRG